MSDQFIERQKHHHTATSLAQVAYLVDFQDREVFQRFFITLQEECPIIGPMAQYITHLVEKQGLEVMLKIHSQV